MISYELGILIQDDDGEIENFGESIFKIRIPNFCYIQVIDYNLQFLTLASGIAAFVIGGFSTGIPNNIDYYTINNDFSGDVLARAKYFSENNILQCVYLKTKVMKLQI